MITAVCVLAMVVAACEAVLAQQKEIR